jgi:hypothetical protein
MVGFASFFTPSPVFTAYENGMSRWPSSLPSTQFVSLC